MKIVAVDNYNRDSVSDVLVAENVPAAWADALVNAWQEQHKNCHSDRWLMVKPDDYRLYEFKP